MDQADLDHQLASIAVLGDPVRRALYLYVAAQPQSVTRDEAARATGVSPGVAGFHLNRLLREGLLAASYRRLSSRGGPGAGRPSKLYRRSRRQFSVILPPRNYELLARLLVESLERMTPASHETITGVAHQAGRRLGAVAGTQHAGMRSNPDVLSAAEAVLTTCGFQPYRHSSDEIYLRNCPFQALASDHRDVVCRANVSLMRGLVTNLGASDVEVAYDPEPEVCCVKLRRVSSVESGE